MLSRSLLGSFVLCVVFGFVGCGGDDTSSAPAAAGQGGSQGGGAGSQQGGAGKGGTGPVEVELDGSVQKGPLVLGSSVAVSTVDASGDPTGQVFNTSTEDDLGNFSLAFTYQGGVSIEGSGYYYNEVTGELSASDLTLRAFYDVSQDNSQAAHVNILTHLIYGRVKRLLEEAAANGAPSGAGGADPGVDSGGAGEPGSSADGASGADGAGGDAPLPAARGIPEAIVAQAESELRASLAIGGEGFDPGTSAVHMNMIGSDSDADAYLFAVSAIFTEIARQNAQQGGSLEAELQELLNTASSEFAETGALPDTITWSIPTVQQSLDPDRLMTMLQTRLNEVNSGGTVPDLHRVWDSDGDGHPNASDNCARVANPTQEPVNDVCSYRRVVPQSFGYASMSFGLIGDFTGDGHGDLLVGASEFGLYPGDGTGDLGARIATPVAEGLHNPFPNLLLPRARDMNADGHLDVVANAANTSGHTGVYFNDGTGIFSAPTLVVGTPLTYGAGTVSSLNHYAILDANGDGALDFAGSIGNDDELHLLFAQGDDTWGGAIQVALPDEVAIRGLTSGDLDGDGHEDLALLSSEQGSSPGGLYLLWGTGAADAPHFTVDPALTSAGTTLSAVAIADLVGDTELDLVVAGNDGLFVFPGDGTRTLGTPVEVEGFFDAAFLRAGDVSGDGKSDIVTGGYSGVGFLLGDGSTFTQGAGISIPSGMVEQLEAGDLNGDGKLDLFLTATSYSTDFDMHEALLLLNP